MSFKCPATLCILINQVFQEYLDQFIVVYLDNIVIYNVILEKQKIHMKLVFDKL